ncbi:DNA-binding IclR family transcriptional regulator [Rhodococcus fascians]|uniref:IclR family transcriptional regulator n=1 Tax=Nocardiaceae TaxID=85025 RepID=UPI00050C4453|nr:MULTISPECIES: IclR family transcriptional regulator [Rhodococcus]MDR6910727.1 DNA-binding IclR family transcriptional regulator [Rhodococcus sp. 3258]MDR6931906.1 DNA-binding IclR family transcriptional regulator [Rhodococcus fascians]
MRTTRSNTDPASVVDRMTAIVEAFQDSGPLTLSDVTRRTGMPRSTAHRLLEQLTTTRWLVRDRNTYELGVRAYEIGQWALSQNRLRIAALPVLHKLARTTGMTIHLGNLEGNTVFYVDRIPGSTPLRLPTRVGARLPAHVTGIGKIMLANAGRDATADPDADSDELDQPLRPLTQYSLSTREQLDAELERTRDRGVAIDRQETVVGIGCVAASIGPADHFYGNRSAISLCGPVQEMNFAQLGGVARMAAREIWDACVANDLR